jgi:hypothetical protein
LVVSCNPLLGSDSHEGKRLPPEPEARQPDKKACPVQSAAFRNGALPAARRHASRSARAALLCTSKRPKLR